MELSYADVGPFLRQRGFVWGALCFSVAGLMACSRTPAVLLGSPLVIEKISITELVEEEILSQPLQFTVTPERDAATWVRARYFFRKYVSGEPIVSDVEFFSDLHSKDHLHYQVLRVVTPSGVEYSVECTPAQSAHAPIAELNAKNLARFLERGQLAVELLQARKAATLGSASV